MIEEKINIWLDKCRGDLIDNYIKTGRKASGNWGRTLDNFVTKSETKLSFGVVGEEYTGALIYGRSPNKQNTGGLLDAIKQWVIDKNIQINPYAVTRKIAKEGIKIPNKYNKGDILSNVLTDNYIESSIDIVSEYYGTKLKNWVKNVL